MAKTDEFVFAGSTKGEPWWTIGEITRDLLRPHGIEVTVTDQSASTENPRWVGRGDALVGACMMTHVKLAQRGIEQYEGEEFPEFKSIATVLRPSWFAGAIRKELGFNDLHEVAKARYPVRVLMPKLSSVASVLPRKILEYHGISLDSLRAWGGEIKEIHGHPYAAHVREHDVDVILANLYLGYTPISRYWHDASTLLNLRFISFDDALLTKLSEEGYGEPGIVPKGLYRGVDSEKRALYRGDIIIYSREDLDDDLAYLLAKSYERGRRRFLGTNVHMAYDAGASASSELGVHPGAAKYYREIGLG